ncbi:MAG: chaperonin GroEL [Firmicutes bacterium]|nr:chaperonin GroEL [Bacillota bacterium]
MEKIITNASTKKKILSGAKKLHDIVALTLGPCGNNVIVMNGVTPLVTNDGVTIARNVVLDDPFENMVARTILQASHQTNKTVGDGTTSSIILASAIIEKGIDHKNPIALKDELNIAKQKAIKVITDMAKKITTRDELESIAFNSCQNKNLANMVATAFANVGRDGVVTITENETHESTIIFTEGCEVNMGLATSYMCNDTARLESTYENARILVTTNPIKSVNDILPTLEIAMREKFPLVIIAPDFSSEVTAALVLNRVKVGLDVIALKIHELGERRDAIMNDIAAMTNAMAFSHNKIDDIDLDNLGYCERIIAGMNTTKIIAGASERLQQRIETIHAQINDTTDEFNKTALKNRLAKLTGGIAIISVGGTTPVERTESKLRLDDAIHATRAALEGGIVPGGGITYLRAADAVHDSCPILASALESIIEQICKNSHVDWENVIQKIRESNNKNLGFDARKKDFCNMIESNIIDPADVVTNVIQNAVSVAGTLLTTQGMIAQ